MPDLFKLPGTAATATLVCGFALLSPRPDSIGATEIYHCVGNDGGAVYSEQPCGPNAEMLSIESHERLDGKGDESPNAIEQLRNYRQNVKDIEDLVGRESTPASARSQKKSNPCARVTSLQMRNARVGKQVIKCHSQADVRAILGLPQSVYTWSDNKSYDTRWTYLGDKGRQEIYFKQGRVTRMNKKTDQ